VVHRTEEDTMTEPTTPRHEDTVISSPMIATLEAAWTAIRAQHPELPPVVVTMAGADKVPGGVKLGHFHANRWTHREAATTNALAVGADAAKTYAEIMVCGETLARQPHEIMATLLGEAAHALGHVRGLQTSSRQGRYANGTFHKIATEVGIETTKDPRPRGQSIGYTITGMPDETLITYIDVIASLTANLTHVRVSDVPALAPVPADAPVPAGGGLGVRPAPSRAKRPGARCGCPDREVHIARKDLAQAPIICGVCLTPFAYAD